MARMRAWLERFNPFKTPEAKRLAVMFGVVYFAQGMWYLPNQTITIILKDRGLSAGQVADFLLEDIRGSRPQNHRLLHLVVRHSSGHELEIGP